MPRWVFPEDDPQADYEAELGVVIGRAAKGVSEADAMKYVAGYFAVERHLRETMAVRG